MKCIILAGGKGDRLWPLSRQNYPKQFIKIQGDHSLFQETIARNMPFCDEFIIVTNKEYEFIVKNQVSVFQGLIHRVILEDIGRKTTAAITLAVMPLPKSELVLVIPADQVISGSEYSEDIIHAKKLALDGSIVTCGMKIVSPEEKYGYIQFEGENVVQFVEKPDYSTAVKYMNSGKYLVNSGMLVFRVGDYVRELKKYSPNILDICSCVYKKRKQKGNKTIYLFEQLCQIPSEHIEKTLLEKTDRVKVVHSRFKWKDIGCFEDIKDTDLKFNLWGEQICYECNNTEVINNCAGSLVVADGLDDIVVVNTSDAVYVGHKRNGENLKKIVNIDSSLAKFFEEGRIVYRQWGTYELLVDMPKYRVKHVVVSPGKTIFSHKHIYRSEHWSIVSGEAYIELNGKGKKYYINDVVDVEPGVVHQVSNEGDKDLVVIEVSVGENVTEDDKVAVREFDTLLEENKEIEPFVKLLPAYKDSLWGGIKLKEVYNKKCDYDILAESWELSAHDEGQSIIASGKYKGMLFAEYLDAIGKNAWGWKCSSFEKFPILIKFIDARDYLSIQVHPDDEYALKMEEQYGKNEMWYIVDCEPGSYIYCGFIREVTKNEIIERMKNGTITEVLNKINVEKGQTYFIEAGTVHAIGAGILICEIQQSSTCTYRLYDFDREDKFGNKRELHIDKALDVLNYCQYKAQELSGTVEKGKGHISRVIGTCKYFESLEVKIEETYYFNGVEESFTSIICIDGEGIIKCENNSIVIFSGESIFIPKNTKRYEIVGKMTMILSRV